MATASASTTETKESREQDKTSASPIVIVELDEPQSASAVRRLRKGKGKLFEHVERILKDLAHDGTVKANAQPVVFVLQEIPEPPWARFTEDDDD
jgi:hypothetical protein